MKKILFLVVVLSNLLIFFWVNGDALKEPTNLDIPKGVHVFSTEATFEDAKDDLLAAIEERGLVISYTSHAKSMFDRTAKVTGAKTPIYDNAEILLFCKATSSHDLVKSNPHNIILCPYAIAIYVLHTEPNRVYLSYKDQDNSQEVTVPISQLLESIIADVI